MEDLELEQIAAEPEVPWWRDLIDITGYGIAAGIAAYLLTLVAISRMYPY